MFKQSLILILFWFVANTLVSAQETGGFTDPMAPYSPASSVTNREPGYRVSGTFISSSNRVVVLNGRIAREGDTVDGAEILSIHAKSVRIRSGSRERMVYLGSNEGLEQASVPTMQISRKPTSRKPLPERGRLATPMPSGVSSPLQASVAHKGYGPVKRGETLSGIAEQYRDKSVSMDQMMLALFKANPKAFSGNINVLHEGAVLRMPNGNELFSHPPEMATAEVLRQQDAWRTNDQQQAGPAKVAQQESYGPVKRGETLSGIAEGYLSVGITMDQMTIALFQANPQAFRDNINILYEGAVLRIPTSDELLDLTPATATADVIRQTIEWRAGSMQQARVNAVPIDSSMAVDFTGSISRVPVSFDTRAPAALFGLLFNDLPWRLLL